MKLPFVSRRRHERESVSLRAELDRVTADRERLRGERDQFAKDRDAAKAAANTAARQLAEADAAIRRVTDRNLELARALDTQKRRADRLASHLDDGDIQAIKRWEARVKVHDAWTAPADLEGRPVDGASARPMYPATELRRALDRCRRLQALLDGRGKRGAS